MPSEHLSTSWDTNQAGWLFSGNAWVLQWLKYCLHVDRAACRKLTQYCNYYELSRRKGLKHIPEDASGSLGKVRKEEKGVTICYTTDLCGIAMLVRGVLSNLRPTQMCQQKALTQPVVPEKLCFCSSSLFCLGELDQAMMAKAQFCLCKLHLHQEHAANTVQCFSYDSKALLVCTWPYIK